MQRAPLSHLLRSKFYDATRNADSKIVEWWKYSNGFSGQDTDQHVRCWVYFLRKFKPELLKYPMLESYTSAGSHGRQYMERSKRDPNYQYQFEVLKVKHWVYLAFYVSMISKCPPKEPFVNFLALNISKVIWDRPIVIKPVIEENNLTSYWDDVYFWISGYFQIVDTSI